jgi:hypothetical protein
MTQSERDCGWAPQLPIALLYGAAVWHRYSGNKQVWTIHAGKRPPSNHTRRGASQLTSTRDLVNPEDRQFVEAFVNCVLEPAQEPVTGQSKFSAHELLQLAGYRIGARRHVRPSFNKVNPFNLFLNSSMSAEDTELRKSTPLGADINQGRPSFTGAYQKHLAEEYKPLKLGSLVIGRFISRELEQRARTGLGLFGPSAQERVFGIVTTAHAPTSTDYKMADRSSSPTERRRSGDKPGGSEG